jgi:hypothetical protein
MDATTIEMMFAVRASDRQWTDHTTGHSITAGMQKPRMTSLASGERGAVQLRCQRCDLGDEGGMQGRRSGADDGVCGVSMPCAASARADVRAARELTWGQTWSEPEACTWSARLPTPMQ